MSLALPHRRRRRRALAACLLASVATALGAATDPDRAAAAGTYTVYTCKTPSGVWTGMEGWTSVAGTQIPGHDNGNATGCAAPSGSFSLQYGSTGLSALSGSWVSWTFTAPLGTTIGSLSVHRTFNLGWPVVRDVANRPYVLQSWFDDSRDANLIDFAFSGRGGETLTQANPLELRNADVSWRSLSLTLRCWDRVGQLDCASFPAQATFSKATLGLRDTTPPQAYTLAGSLVSGSTLRGAAAATYEAADEGGGVYRSILSVDASSARGMSSMATAGGVPTSSRATPTPTSSPRRSPARPPRTTPSPSTPRRSWTGSTGSASRSRTPPAT